MSEEGGAAILQPNDQRGGQQQRSEDDDGHGRDEQIGEAANDCPPVGRTPGGYTIDLLRGRGGD